MLQEKENGFDHITECSNGSSFLDFVLSKVKHQEISIGFNIPQKHYALPSNQYKNKYVLKTLKI